MLQHLQFILFYLKIKLTELKTHQTITSHVFFIFTNRITCQNPEDEFPAIGFTLIGALEL